MADHNDTDVMALVAWLASVAFCFFSFLIIIMYAPAFSIPNKDVWTIFVRSVSDTS